MNKLSALIKRNVKLFFKDRGMFFASMITPAILLLLYSTFLWKSYKDGFTSTVLQGVGLSDSVIDGFIGGQLASSVLAVSCVTVAFCSNMVMVQDKALGNVRDLNVAPVRPALLALGYYISALISTLIVCFAATGLCLAYVHHVGWYMSGGDIAYLLLDVVLLSMFGTALSSGVNFFLSSQGQISAVGTIVSAGYGFICGAYMPISQFSKNLQRVVSYFPGYYGTSIMRVHAMRGACEQMASDGAPDKALDWIKDFVDWNVYFDDKLVSMRSKYMILGLTVAALVAVYIVMNVIRNRKSV